MGTLSWLSAGTGPAPIAGSPPPPPFLNHGVHKVECGKCDQSHPYNYPRLNFALLACLFFSLLTFFKRKSHSNSLALVALWTLYTVTLFGPVIPIRSFYTVILYGHSMRYSIRSLYTVTLYGHSIRSLYTATLYGYSTRSFHAPAIPIWSQYAVTLYGHSIRSLHTAITLHGHSIQ